MKIYTSYFYQIRFFPETLIPLSTCLSDPKYFHDNKGIHHQFKDKNGVWNGLRAEPFVPNETCEGLCYGPNGCPNPTAPNCAFLQTYLTQLRQLNFVETIERFRTLGNKIKEVEGWDREPDFALIVYEAPQNICSERSIIQQWFAENGKPISELKFK